MTRKTDQEKFLATASAIAKGLAIGAMAFKQGHDVFEELFEIWDEEEAIAPQATQKQLPARRRRKSNG